MKSHYWKFGFGMGFLFIAMVLLTGTAVMVLWNHLMPAIFGLPEIFFGQAIGLLVLSRLLMGGFGKWGGRGSCGGGWNHRSGYGWKEKWGNMTPEERQQMKSKYYSYCSWKKEGKGTSEGGEEEGKGPVE